MTAKEYKVSGSTLKIIACVCMLIDHFAASVLNYYINTLPSSVLFANSTLLNISDIMRCIGRIAFPIFCFLMAEGFVHTRSKLKYLRNLLIFAIISEIPFDLALFSGEFFYPAYQNVFFTLFLAGVFLYIVNLIQKGKFEHKAFTPLAYLGCLFGGVIVVLLWNKSYFGQAVSAYAQMRGIEEIGTLFGEILACIFAVIYIIKTFTLLKPQKIRDCLCLMTLLAVIIIADLIHCDYGGFGVATIALMYTLNTRKKSYPVMTLAFGILLLTLLSPIEAFAFFGLIPVAFYNHKRGLKLKYFFYAFYPVHLLLLYLISLVAGLI